MSRTGVFFNGFALFFLLVFSLEAAPPAATSRLRAPSKVVHKSEAELFQGLSQGIGSMGRVSEDEKKIFSQTVEKEKQAILRRTTEQIYDNAFQLYRQGRYGEAVEILNRIVTLDPTFDKAARLRSALSSSGGLQEAAPRVSAGRDLVDDRFYEAITVYKEGRKIEAIQKFEEVLALDPKHRKAQYYIHRVNSDLAKEYFEKGKLAYTQGRLEDALESFYSAVHLDSEGYSFLHRQIADLETEVRSRKIEYQLTQALSKLNAGEWGDARSTAKEIFSLDPVNRRAQEIIDEAYRKEADEYLTQGDSFAKRKDFEKAIGQYEKVAKLGKYQAAKAKDKIADIRARIRREEEEAERKRQEEEARKETEARVKAALGKKGEEGKPGEMESMDDGTQQPQVVSQEAKMASESHYQQAMKFYQTGDLQRALAQLNLSLKYDPNNQNAYTAKRRIEADLAK